MKDWKADLKQIKLRARDSDSAPDLQIESSPSAELSAYEEFLEARKALAIETGRSIKKRDFELVQILQKRVQFFQRQYQEEVTQYRHLYPNLTLDQISKQAHQFRIAETEKRAKEEAELRERAEQEAKQLVEAEKKLVAAAKRLIREKGLRICTNCENGRVKTPCKKCGGTGSVAPYRHLVMKLIWRGGIQYPEQTEEVKTACPEKKCYMGIVVSECPSCKGLRVVTKDGKPLSEHIRSKMDVIERVCSMLGLM